MDVHATHQTQRAFVITAKQKLWEITCVFANFCNLCPPPCLCREDAFQEYVELEAVYLDCLEAAAQGSAHSGGVGSHTDFGG